MNDDVVDEMGHTNAGYGSTLPTTYFAGNHILSGHLITTPRDEGPMRNNVAQNWEWRTLIAFKKRNQKKSFLAK